MPRLTGEQAIPWALSQDGGPLDAQAVALFGGAEDALDDATTALQHTPAVEADWRSKLDILRTLMNGR